MRIFWPAKVNGGAPSAPLIGSAFPILLPLKDRKHVLKGPALGPVLSPTVVVGLRAACPDHGVDRAAAAKHVAEGHIELATVQSRRWDNGQVKIERTGHVVKPDAWFLNGRCVIGP